MDGKRHELQKGGGKRKKETYQENQWIKSKTEVGEEWDWSGMEVMVKKSPKELNSLKKTFHRIPTGNIEESLSKK